MYFKFTFFTPIRLFTTESNISPSLVLRNTLQEDKGVIPNIVLVEDQISFGGYSYLSFTAPIPCKVSCFPLPIPTYLRFGVETVVTQVWLTESIL